MKTSQATTQLKDIKKGYFYKLLFSLIITYLIIFLIGIFYCLPLYSNVFWKSVCLSDLSFLYSDSNVIQTIIVASLCCVLLIIGIILTLVFSYKNNSKYQEAFLKLLYNELMLNEIYLQNKRRIDESADLDMIYKSYGLKNIERNHLFTFKSLIEMDFYQFFSIFHCKKDYSLLIKAKVEKGLNGYLTLQFDNNYTIEEYNEKEIFQYNFRDTRKYPYDVFANSSLGKETYDVVDENVLNTFIQLKKFTGTNIRATLSNNLFYVLIPGWELKLTDSLYRKIKYDTMDKKVECFTELIDEITDLYVYLINKEDVWQKKW